MSCNWATCIKCIKDCFKDQDTEHEAEAPESVLVLPQTPVVVVVESNFVNHNEDNDSISTISTSSLLEKNSFPLA